VDISKAWENTRENTKASFTGSLGCYELKQHTQLFDEECPKLLYYRRQAKFQWLVNTS